MVLSQILRQDNDLLSLSNSRYSHNVSSKDFDRFMTDATQHQGKKRLLSIQFFSNPKVLERHTKNCLAINHKKSALLPGEGANINFQNFIRTAKHH